MVRRARIALVVIARPWLWPVLVEMAPTGWWRRLPPWPFPSREYMRFRAETMYGPSARTEPDDVLRYLEWCRRVRPSHPSGRSDSRS